MHILLANLEPAEALLRHYEIPDAPQAIYKSRGLSTS